MVATIILLVLFSVILFFILNNSDSGNVKNKPLTNTNNFLNNLSNMERIKIILMWLMIIVAVIFIIIAFASDYSTAMKNEENFWYGQYMTTAIFHTLCALFFLKLAQLLHK